MKRSIACSMLAAALGFGLALSPLPAEAGAGKTRSGGKAGASRPSSGASGARASGSAGRSAARASGRASHSGVRASGRATYGYGRHRHSGYGHRGYGYYGVGYWPYSWWGYPYYGYGWPYFWGYGSGPYWGHTRGEYRDRFANDPGVVETDIKPRKADVRLDGEWVGQARDYNGSWDQLIVKPGDHTLEFSKEGYQTLRYHLSVDPGTYHRVAQRLQKGEGLDPRSDTRPAPAPAPSSVADAPGPAREGSAPARLQSALLRIRATPGDAAVYLDGEFLARADELSRLHGALPVAAGDHLIEVVRPGFDSLRRQVSVGGEQPTVVEFDLARKE